LVSWEKLKEKIGAGLFSLGDFNSNISEIKGENEKIYAGGLFIIKWEW